MTEKKDSFCIMPFVHLHNMSNGLLKMCCITENPIVDDFGKTMFIGNQSIEDVWNSNFLITARNKMLANERVSICTNCYRVEDTGGTSLRQEYNSMYKEEFLKFVDEAKENNGVVKTFPAFVELRTGNTCNSACRMCNSNDSSLVHKENTEIHATLKNKNFESGLVKHGYRMIGNPDKVIFGLQDDRLSTAPINLNKHIDDIIDNIEHIDLITLSGGEPFLLEKTEQLIEIIAEKNPSIRLHINTNGSVVSDKILIALQKISEVRICVSIDGYGSVQEYIRYPLKWKKIENNLDRFSLLARKGFYITFNVTVQAFNILNLEDLLVTLVTRYAQSYINLSILNNPPFFDIKQLPRHIKEEAQKRNEVLAEKIKSIPTSIDYVEENKLRLANRLLELNSYMMSAANDREAFDMLKSNVKIYDHYRKQNISDYIPDLAKFL